MADDRLDDFAGAGKTGDPLRDAAPELLAALDFMVNVSRGVSGFSPMARQQAERAIAKARGEA